MIDGRDEARFGRDERVVLHVELNLEDTSRVRCVCWAEELCTPKTHLVHEWCEGQHMSEDVVLRLGPQPPPLF
eukprot:7239368-Prymnesium_polylepis.2